MAEDHQQEVYFSGAGHTADEEKLRAFERAGMHEIRRFWVMARPNLPNLPPVRFPEGFEWRVPRLGEDDDEVLDSMNDSFSEHFGFSPDTMEWYQHYVHSINYRPELTVLARENGRNRVAGFCQIVVNEGENSRLGVKRGWIDILGVRREYRRRGLGEALIIQGMHNLRAAGLSEAVLACDSENTTNATALYFKTGFQVRKTTIVYDKSLREPAAEQRRELAKV